MLPCVKMFEIIQDFSSDWSVEANHPHVKHDAKSSAINSQKMMRLLAGGNANVKTLTPVWNLQKHLADCREKNRD